MNYFIFILLLLVSSIFYIFEISFRSFSKISLVGFLDDFQKGKIKKFDFVKKYHSLRNSLTAFSMLCELILFIYTFFLLADFIPNQIYRVIVLTFFTLFIFNFFLYIVAHINKERFLKKLIFLYPIPWVFFYPANKIFSYFMKKHPENKENEQDDLSDKELEIFFEESTKEGVLEKEDKDMIKSVIKFGDKLVKEIMTPRVDIIYIDINTKKDDFIKTINENKKSRYPVISDSIDNIEGVILLKDVFNHLRTKNISLRTILRPAFFIPETMRIFELLKEMQKSKQKFAIVVDEFGGISGVVTMEDIIEEIVGDIKDEYDDDIEQIVKEKDYFIVKGDTDISELSNTLQIQFGDDEDYQTISGLISFKLGRIPKISDKIFIDKFSFEVIETEKNRIKKVKIHLEK